MKKLFTTLMAAAAVSLGASAQYIINFDDYTSLPEEGVVSELSTIKVTFPNIYELEINSKDGIYMMDGNFDEYDGKVEVSDNVLTYTLNETITASGTYYLMIGEGSLCGWAQEYADLLDNPEMYLTYNISNGGGGGNDDGFNFEATVDPAEGIVTSLKTITVTFPNIEDIDISVRDMCTFTYNGTKVQGVQFRNTDADENKIVVTLPSEMTAGGEYVLMFEDGALTGYNFNFNPFYKDNDEAISFAWTIESSASDFDVTATPISGSVLPVLDEIVLNVGEAEFTDVNLNAISIEVGTTVLDSSVDFEVEYSTSTASILFTEAVIADDEVVPVKVTLAPGALVTNKGENTEVIELTYNVAPAVKEDLMLTLTGATKLNENGEINVGEKQISAFFFSCDVAGLDAAETDVKNVVAESKNENINYHAEATLAKGYGINSSLSYFSADFHKEPDYNGEYEITIAAGSFGNAEWIENHDFGRTNPEIVILFNIIGGKTTGVEVLEVMKSVNENAEIYTLDGKRMQADFSALPAGIYVVNGRKFIKK